MLCAMDQGVIRSFKTGYITQFLYKCTTSEKDDHLDITKEYNIKDCILATTAAWKAVKPSTMVHAWNHLLKASEDDTAEKEEEEDLAEDIDTIQELSRKVGLTDLRIDEELEDNLSDDEIISSENETENDDDTEDEQHQNQKILKLKHLQEIKLHVEALVKIIQGNDENEERDRGHKT